MNRASLRRIPIANKKAESDGYQIFEETIDGWHCAVMYRVFDGARLIPCPCYDVRWWIVTNEETHKFFVWVYESMQGEPEGHYPRLLVTDGKIGFFMPRKERTDEELDGIVDMVKGA